MINGNKKWIWKLKKVEKKDTTQIYLGVDMGTNMLKFKICFSIMMVICIKQNLSNVWSSIHKKCKQHWGCCYSCYSKGLQLWSFKKVGK